VTHPCRDFRSALAVALGEGPRGTRALGWHEHLLGCGDCRALLASEEALDALLASLPEPALEPGAAARVLARLASERAAPRDELDSLLEALPAGAPPELPARVLSGLRPARAEAALDALLGRWESVPAPADLAARTLARLAPARRAPARRRVALRLAAAALVLVGLAAGWRALEAPPAESAPGAVVDGAPPDGLLEALELLESWDLLTDPSLEVALTGLDEAEALLLEIERGRDPLDPNG
jgi:hypothetical protein